MSTVSFLQEKLDTVHDITKLSPSDWIIGKRSAKVVIRSIADSTILSLGSIKSVGDAFFTALLFLPSYKVWTNSYENSKQRLMTDLTFCKNAFWGIFGYTDQVSSQVSDTSSNETPQTTEEVDIPVILLDDTQVEVTDSENGSATEVSEENNTLDTETPHIEEEAPATPLDDIQVEEVVTDSEDESTEVFEEINTLDETSSREEEPPLTPLVNDRPEVVETILENNESTTTNVVEEAPVITPPSKKKTWGEILPTTGEVHTAILVGVISGAVRAYFEGNLYESAITGVGAFAISSLGMVALHARQ